MRSCIIYEAHAHNANNANDDDFDDKLRTEYRLKTENRQNSGASKK